MTDRYFVSRPIDDDAPRLLGGEAHHLLHVMRARLGDEVILFDGSGAEFLARIKKLGRAEVELAVIERRQIDRELSPPLVLGVALPKGDRRRWLIEKSVELGVTRLVPLHTLRSLDRDADATGEKTRQAVIEAAKQCGRNRLLEIAAALPLADFLAAAEGTRIMAHCDAAGSPRQALDRRNAGQPVWLAVGPEGGFGDAEVALAAQLGWQIVSLGARTLRVETAAVALVTAAMLAIDAR